jgi:uncharacterized protein YbcI
MGAEMEHGASLNREISRAIVRLTHEYTGRGPSRSTTTINGTLIVCLLEDTLTRGERVLADKGNKDAVLAMRHQFQNAMRDEAIDEIERLTARRVVSFMSTNHIDPDLAAEIFVLDGDVDRAALAPEH